MDYRRLLIWIGGFWLWLGVAVGVGKAQTPTPTPIPPEPLDVSGPFVDPVLLSLQRNAQTRVTLTLQGNDLACPPQVETGPVDMYLVIDRSSSMDDPAGEAFASKIDAAKAAAQTFLAQVDFNVHRIGVISFNEIANDVAPLLQDRDALEQALNTITTNDGTAIDAGLVRAIHLFEMQGRPEARKVIILLSDGDSSPEPALQAAERAAQQGIRIITVALGPDANQDLLQQLASDPSDFYYAPTTDELQTIYQTIARSVERPRSVTQVQVNLRYDPTAWEVLEVDPETQASEAGMLQWQFYYLPGNRQTLEVVLRPRKAGNFPALQGGIVSYVECEQTQRTLSIDPGPTLEISPPPTPTARPTPTPPPPPSFTAAGSLWSMWFCPQWPWWLLLLWALGWLWWLYRLLTCLFRRSEQCWWCDCLRTLYWPWFLLFLRFLAQPLQSIWCFEWPWSHWWLAVASALPVWLLIPILIALAVYLCERFCPIEERIPFKEEIRKKPEPLPPVQMRLDWQVRPALIIGIGGTGRWVLTHLKQLLMEAGQGQVPEGVRFFVIDTAERETVNRYRDLYGREQTVSFAGVALDEDEIFLLRGDLQSLIQRLAKAATQDSLFADWFPAWDYQILGGQTNLTQGTFGRRPLAKAGLVRHMQEEMPALWQHLLQQIRAVESQGEVRIYLVGSMGGGMSGVLLDLGYLIRKATEAVLQRTGHLRLEALLATPGVYSRVSPALDQQHINAWALARELVRFQRTGRYPYPMHYTGESRPYDGFFEGRLFDKLHLFGGDGYRPQRSASSDAPWASVLASMADFLYLHLDAVLGGRWYQQRDSVWSNAIKREATTDDIVITTVGTFSVRYPFYTLWREVRARWIADMARTLITSLQEERESWEDRSPRALAEAFMEGDESLRIGPAPLGLSVAYRRARGESIGRRELEQAYQQPEDQRAFREYLHHLLLSILNGRLHERGEAEQTRRIGYLRFAARFLDSVEEMLRQTEQALESDTKAGALRQVLQRWLDEVRQARAAIAPWLGTEHEGLTALVRDMEREAQQIRHARQQMEQVSVRHYLWHVPPTQHGDQEKQDLPEYWLKTYGRPRFQSYLERFYWELDDSGRLHWKVVLGEEILLTPESLPKVLDAMSRQAFREIFEEFTFEDLADRHGWLMRTESEQQRLETMWAIARPHLKVESHRDFEHNAVLALTEALRESPLAQKLRAPKDVLPGHLEPTTEAYIEGWSDPNAFILVRFYDLVRLTHVPEVQERWIATYRDALRNRLKDVEPPTRSHVFRAEANAVRFEWDITRRLAVPDFVLGPFLTLACHDPQRLQAFALAHAAGWVWTRQREEGGLTLPDGGRFVRRLVNVEDDPVPATLQLLLHWVLGPFSSDERLFYRQLWEILRNPDPEVLERWRSLVAEWQKGPPASWRQQPAQERQWTALQIHLVWRHLEAVLGIGGR